MDCGSYSKEIIATVHGHCNKSYIRSSRYESLSNEISEITDWKQVELNFENYEVTSILFTAFLEEENYRLVIQRKRKKESEDDLFDGKFVYRCIVTNDWNSTEEEIVTFYNARGAIFDVDLRDCYGMYTDMKKRKNDSRTYFLNKMNQERNKRMELDDNREQRRKS